MADNTYSQRERVNAALARFWVGKGKTANFCLRSFSPRANQALARLELLTRILERGHKLAAGLPRSNLEGDLKKVKRFCEGILEPCIRHDWKPLLRKRDLRTRVSVASSLFLFRKVVLPPEPTESEKKELVDKYISKMSTPQDLPPAELLAFCSSELKRQFRPGWDSGWERACDNFTLPTSSCLENSCRKGGVRGRDRFGLREQFEEFASGVKTDLPRETEPLIVETGGKFRLVTRFSETRSFLSPLHHLIYNHLSTKKWLLRGEATPDKFEGFEQKKGEVFVSGDYESATDNLNVHLSRYILAVVRRQSSHVPSNVWDSASVALDALFPDGRSQQSGQLMGSLLSFPLLCLANYLTFKYSIRREVPVRVNGDDIVFRSTPGEKESWFKNVQASGLVVSKGKTLVAKRVFSLNSTFFLSTPEGTGLVPSVRSTCLFGASEDPNSVAGRLDSVYRGNGVLKDLVQSHLLREVGTQIRSCQRSVRRSLGGTCSNRALRWAGLLDRESFYNSMTGELPLPLTKKEWVQNCIPAGFSRVRSSLGDDPLFSHQMRENCWTVQPRKNNLETTAEYWRRVRQGTFSYVKIWTEKNRRLMKLSVPEFEKLQKFVRARRQEGELCWRKDCVGSSVTFLSEEGTG